MISCLQNYIGAVGIQDEPTSGRYVNDLAGITTERIDESYESNDTYEPVDAWQSIERVAIKRFEQRILSWAKKFFLNYSYISSTITGQYRKKEAVTKSNEYKGVLFDYDFQGNKSLSIHVQFANLYSLGIVNSTEIRAYNAATGELIQTKSVDLSTGDNRIYLGWEFPIWKYTQVFICYDANAVDTIKQTSYEFGGRTSLGFKKVSKSSDVLRANLDSSGNDNGLLLQYNIDCSIDNFVCQRLQLFEEAYMYCLASEVINQSLHSENINRYTLLDFESASQKRIEYEEEFNRMIQDNLNGMTMESDGLCFVCNRAVNHRVMLP